MATNVAVVALALSRTASPLACARTDAPPHVVVIVVVALFDATTSLPPQLALLADLDTMSVEELVECRRLRNAHQRAHRQAARAQ